MLTFFANIGNGLAEWITGFRPYAENDSFDVTSSASISAYRIASICSNVGGFLLSALIFAWFCSNSIGNYFRLRSPLKWKYLAVIVLCFLLAIPAIQLLSELNELISGGAYLMEAQEETSKLRTALLRTDSFAVVLLNVCTMALIPAVGEELFFRGVIMRVSFQGTKNMHWGCCYQQYCLPWCIWSSVISWRYSSWGCYWATFMSIQVPCLCRSDYIF